MVIAVPANGTAVQKNAIRCIHIHMHYETETIWKLIYLVCLFVLLKGVCCEGWVSSDADHIRAVCRLSGSR